jgi:hypothetical protein
MAAHFFYDTHYQVDKPLALIHLTASAAAPSKSSPDHVLAKALADRARRTPVSTAAGPEKWSINVDAMRYWLKVCHAGGLLSAVNAYDYWLMSFVLSRSFRADAPWGTLVGERERQTRLLLFRWAWLHDAPMLTAVLWLIARFGPCPMGPLVHLDAHHIEDAVVAVLSIARGRSSDVSERTELRQLAERVRRGFKYNTRRHKLITHLAILTEAGVVRQTDGAYSVVGLPTFATPEVGQAVERTFEPSAIGHGGNLFLEIVQTAFGSQPQEIAELSDAGWVSILPEVQRWWVQVLAWDRKFLGINALAEYFLVRNLLAGRPLWGQTAWRTFLEARSRVHPEELTVHVGRFGTVEYLRLGEQETPTTEGLKYSSDVSERLP